MVGLFLPAEGPAATPQGLAARQVGPGTGEQRLKLAVPCRFWVEAWPVQRESIANPKLKPGLIEQPKAAVVKAQGWFLQAVGALVLALNCLPVGPSEPFPQVSVGEPLHGVLRAALHPGMALLPDLEVVEAPQTPESNRSGSGT
jgi:hypothetical protein